MGDLKCVNKSWLGWSEIFGFDTWFFWKKIWLAYGRSAGHWRLFPPEFKHAIYYPKVCRNILNCPISIFTAQISTFIFQIVDRRSSCKVFWWVVKHFCVANCKKQQHFICGIAINKIFKLATFSSIIVKFPQLSFYFSSLSSR